ncbi:multifunctional methyltransferase subunit TRM112 [Trypanosoma conorhini]|uniref:Multifunctional methyltransferase subunit TRM112 n=1 Tax=Trypanosoma conorhini TaxID=83891 RepID=A0A3R7L9G8_9TRYP|nr:multifunctional methyltransferase subunit TRM112 [Trypanosoma conorhini]RNF18887.1 multifunctional methyltransferase subunit TRM112 [Trypanosoma conorhini]
MRLLTHNFLCCLECQSFPLQLRDVEAEVQPCEFDSAFIRLMLARMDYGFIVEAFNAVKEQQQHLLGSARRPPETLEDVDLSEQSEDLKAIHHIVQEVAVRQGRLVCPQCQREYPIRDFIPDMVLEGK